MLTAQMIATHSLLVKIFLGFLAGGVVIPFLVKKPLGFKKASFIYTMIFQAIATMVAFAGLVALFAGNLGWEGTTIIMGIVWALMMFIEIKKYKLIKVANLQNSDTLKILKSAFIKISLVQIAFVAIMVALMILKAKGVISL